MKRVVIVACAALAAVVLSSCGGPTAAERKAERERRAEARTRLAGWESKLAATAGGATAGGAEVEALRAILAIQVMELDENAAAIDRFRKHEDLLAGDVMARIYLAVAQSKMAGAAKKIEDKLRWLRAGMSSFESLREEFPDDENVFIYQASTYASFPPEVGAKAEVLDILSGILDRYRSGAWELHPVLADQLAWVFVTLRGNYPDEDSEAEIDEVESAFSADLPVYEAARLRKAAEANRG
jgi:hypothetical protein